MQHIRVRPIELTPADKARRSGVARLLAACLVALATGLSGCGDAGTPSGLLDVQLPDGGLDAQLDALPDGAIPDVQIPDSAGTDAIQPGTDADQPGSDADQPGSDADQPGSDADQPGSDAEQPGSDAEQPGSDADQPGSDAEQPGSDAEQPGSDADQPGSDAEQPGSDADQPGSDADQPGSDADQPGSDADEPGSDADQPGSDADQPGSDADQPGSDAAGSDSTAPVVGCVVVKLIDTQGAAIVGGNVSWTELGSEPTTTAAPDGSVCREGPAGSVWFVSASAADLVPNPAEQQAEVPATAGSCGAPAGCLVVTVTMQRPPECTVDGDCDDANACTSNFCSDGTCAFSATDGAGCSDGNACTTGDVCALGLCKAGTATDCDDNESCTADSCAPDTGFCNHDPLQISCDDNNACTHGDACEQGSCIPGNQPDCNDNNPCTTDSCDTATGNCVFLPVAGTPACDDGNLCTQGETCSDGACGNSQPKDCSDGNPCTIDSCDPQTGACSATAGPDSEPCDDGDACTKQDACVSGSCVGSDPVVCVAKDTCHTAGVCDSSTGVCSDPQKDDGTPCNDFNACTKVDACSAGQCLGSDPVVCPDPEMCKLPGICNTTSGVCFYPNAPANTACSDGNACTENEKCFFGECKSGTAVNCDDNKLCTDDSCNNFGGCLHLYNTLPCDDGDLCTKGDACAGGTCQAGAPAPCDDLNPCTADSCDPAKGCVYTPTSGTCSDGDACTQSDSCSNGVCVGSNPVVCTASDQCHDVGVCNPASGVCSNPNKLDNTACNDGNACTQTDTCQSGVCAGANPIGCTALDQCHDAGVCNPQTGTCSNPAKANGASCNDGNGCTELDTCQQGACSAGIPKVCTAMDQCHLAGSCDAQTGACSNPAKPDASACNDGNACTQTDTCQSGTCTGSNPVVCAALDQCHDAGSCDPQSGQCSNPNKPAGSACNDGNACTNADGCTDGVCVGQSVVCTALDDCHVAGSCDPVSGNCSNPDKEPSAYDDNIACTIDACSGGQITHTPDGSQCGLLEQCDPGAGCVAVAEAGSVIISEFQALGSEFVELHNTTANPIDVRGWVLRNSQDESATLRAADDPLGLVGTPVIIPAGGRLYGIANPGSPVGGGVGFFWGPPASGFDLADSGDVLILASSGGEVVHDFVDFRALVSNPDTPLTASSFVASATASAQLEPTKLTAANNNSPQNWCTTFFAAAGSSRVSSTAGAANGSCQRIVINEVVIDPFSSDDQKAWIELAGPGGALVTGYRILDIEGKGASAGTLNTDGDINSGAADGEFTIPTGVRIPADGYLLIADADTAVSTTQVPGFVSGVDLLGKDMDFENGGGDALQLIRPDGTLADVLGHDANGANLDTNTASNGQAMYETATAKTAPAGSGSVSVALARSALSADTDNNAADFKGDPTPTPGTQNDAVNFSITLVDPNDGLAAYGAKDMIITGSDLAPGLKIKAGALAETQCTINTATQATCSVAANTGSAHGRVDLVFTPHASLGVPAITLLEGFAFTRALFGGSLTEEADYRVLSGPLTMTLPSGSVSPLVYCRMHEAGETDAPGAPAGWIAEVGYSLGASAHPTASDRWRFYPMSYNAQFGNDDEFAGSFTVPAGIAGTVFRYACRFSKDGGISWSYADSTGVLASDSLTFSAADQGTLTLSN